MATKNYPKRSNPRGSSASQGKKHSGCSFISRDKNGNPCTTGWNYSKRFGLRSFLAVCTKNTKDNPSNSGRSWLNVMVKVSAKMQEDIIVSGLMDPNNGKVIIEKWGMVMNPKAPNGGYVGKY